MTLGILALVLCAGSVALCVQAAVLLLAPRGSEVVAARIAALAGGRALSPLPGDTVLKGRALSDHPAVDALLSELPGTAALARLLLAAGLRLRAARLLALLVPAALVLAILSLAAGAPVLVALLAAGSAFAVPLLVLRGLRQRRTARFTAQLPEALELLVRTLKAGNAFTSGLRVMAAEMGGPLGAEFTVVHEELKLGRELADSLEAMRDRMDTTDVRLLCTSLIIQRETGGNLVEMLQNLADLVRRRLEFAGKLRAMTAEGRLSALVLSALPPAMVLVLFLLNRPYAEMLVAPGMLRWVVLGAAVLQALGALWIRRIVTVRY